MLKRLVSSYLLFLAFILMQVHNCIPHHHHDDDIVKDHHHDGDENDTDDHSYPFNDQSHSSDFGRIIEQPQPLKFTYNNFSPVDIDFTTEQIIIFPAESPPFNHWFGYKYIFHPPA